MRVQGAVAPGFELVREEFERNFTERGDVGAGCAVYAGGALVVDLWAGAAGDQPWQASTRSLGFSVSKGITTTCVLMAAERGLLDLDQPVCAYWPEFAHAGKQSITVRQALAHRAGLIAPEADLTLSDLKAWHPVANALAEQAPMWPNAEEWAYHALTHGWLAGEILRRVSGLRPSQWLEREIVTPLGLQLSFGTTDRTSYASMVEPLPERDPEAAERIAASLANPVMVRAFTLGSAFDPTQIFTALEAPSAMEVEIPAANLVGNARSLARFYAALIGEVDGVRLLSEESVRDASQVQSSGAPFVGLDEGNRWGTGYMISSVRRAMLGEGSFGHDGAGGQLAFANPGLGASFAYQTVRPGDSVDERANALCAALMHCLELADDRNICARKCRLRSRDLQLEERRDSASKPRVRRQWPARSPRIVQEADYTTVWEHLPSVAAMRVIVGIGDYEAGSVQRTVETLNRGCREPVEGCPARQVRVKARPERAEEEVVKAVDIKQVRPLKLATDSACRE